MDGPHYIFDADLRLHEVAIGAKCFTALTLVFATEGGHHDDFYATRFGGAAENVEHIKATDFWHHDIGNDERRSVFDGECQRFLAVPCTDDIVAFCEQPHPIDFAQTLVIFYQ